MHENKIPLIAINHQTERDPLYLLLQIIISHNPLRKPTVTLSNSTRGTHTHKPLKCIPVNQFGVDSLTLSFDFRIWSKAINCSLSTRKKSNAKNSSVFIPPQNQLAQYTGTRSSDHVSFSQNMTKNFELRYFLRHRFQRN